MVKWMLELHHRAFVADGGSVLNDGGRYSGCGFVWRWDGERGDLFDGADDIVKDACLKAFAFMVLICREFVAAMYFPHHSSGCAISH